MIQIDDVVRIKGGLLMDDIKLKPCPFCGNKAEITKRNHSEEGLTLKVGCANSFCFCRITRNLWINWTETEVEYEISKMVKTWNNREGK